MAIYLGTAAPSAYYLGSTAVSKLYLGSTQVWPVASAALLTIARNNGTSTFSGSGTTASPFTRAAGIYLEENDGLSRYTWTATASGTITVKFDYSDDNDGGAVARIYKNGSSLYTGLGAALNITRSFAIVSGDTVTIGADNSDTGRNYFSNVSVSAA